MQWAYILIWWEKHTRKIHWKILPKNSSYCQAKWRQEPRGHWLSAASSFGCIKSWLEQSWIIKQTVYHNLWALTRAIKSFKFKQVQNRQPNIPNSLLEIHISNWLVDLQKMQHLINNKRIQHIYSYQTMSSFSSTFVLAAHWCGDLRPIKSNLILQVFYIRAWETQKAWVFKSIQNVLRSFAQNSQPSSW